MSSADLKAAATGDTTKAENPVVAFKGMLEARKTQIQAALPRHMTADRVIRLMLTEFTKNPALRECTQQSIYAGVIQASQLGLEIGLLGQAYLVPFNNKIKAQNGKPEHWRKEAQMIPGYKGLISLARRSGDVSSIETHIVYENDEFDMVLGIHTKIEHKPLLDGDRGKPRLVYGVAHFKDGSHHFEWMPMADVKKIQASSKAGTFGPWVDHFDQMARKTLLRRMANYLPMSVEFAAALEIDSATSAGKAATLEGEFTVMVADENESEPVQEGAGQPAQLAGEQQQAAKPAGRQRAQPKAADPQPAAQEAGAAAAAPAGQGDQLPAGSEAAKAADIQPPALTFALVQEKMKKAFAKGDLALLDVEADLINALPDDQRPELQKQYRDMRGALVA